MFCEARPKVAIWISLLYHSFSDICARSWHPWASLFHWKYDRGRLPFSASALACFYKKYVFYPYGLFIMQSELRALINAKLAVEIAYWTRQTYGVGSFYPVLV